MLALFEIQLVGWWCLLALLKLMVPVWLHCSELGPWSCSRASSVGEPFFSMVVHLHIICTLPSKILMVTGVMIIYVLPAHEKMPDKMLSGLELCFQVISGLC